MAAVDRAQLASLLDHTLLAPEATPADVEACCAEAVDLQVAAACVSPRWVAVAAARLEGTGVALASVVGFPSGAHRSDVKAAEARVAAEQGATEIDLVVSLGAVAAGTWAAVAADVSAVAQVLPDDVVLKAIVESALWDDRTLTEVCRVSVDAGAAYVKTSTGFHPAGGATVHAVEVMRAAVGEHIGVKASGGIRTAEAALAMVGAGATRIGASSSRTVLDGLA